MIVTHGCVEHVDNVVSVELQCIFGTQGRGIGINDEGIVGEHEFEEFPGFTEYTELLGDFLLGIIRPELKRGLGFSEENHFFVIVTLVIEVSFGVLFCFEEEL